MKLYYEIIDALFPLLALPPTSAATTSLASAIAVVAVAILIVLVLAAAFHCVCMPLLSLLASARRRAWFVTPLALALATVDPKEVHVRPLLRLPHHHGTMQTHCTCQSPLLSLTLYSVG